MKFIKQLIYLIKMLHKFIFISYYFLRRRKVIHYYKYFQKRKYQFFERIKDQQEKQLKKLVEFVYKNVPYYTRLFDQICIKPSDITSIKDLEKLPILTKQTIKKNWQNFIPKNINELKSLNGSTGGSTGEPLKYRMSLNDYVRGISLLYRGWGYGGYKLGDKVAMIGGSSLIPSQKLELKMKIRDYFLNIRRYSSFEMSKENLTRYIHDMNKWKPDFLRGYPSSIYQIATFIRENNLKIKFQPKSIFTTAEKLFYNNRTLIEKVFGTKVFDGYGLNDGGISAYECEAHDGMHIDMERAILEVSDSNGKQIINKEGKILATSLYNYSLPFIRYDTGDLGTISYSRCPCGCKMLLLTEIAGRITDSLKLNNIIIGSPVLTVLMGKFDIETYQIIQEKFNSIVCKIIKGKTYKKEDEEFIKKSFYSHVGKINIKFDYVNSIPTTKASKYKFIINNMKEIED